MVLGAHAEASTPASVCASAVVSACVMVFAATVSCISEGAPVSAFAVLIATASECVPFPLCSSVLVGGAVLLSFSGAFVSSDAGAADFAGVGSAPDAAAKISYSMSGIGFDGRPSTYRTIQTQPSRLCRPCTFGPAGSSWEY